MVDIQKDLSESLKEFHKIAGEMGRCQRELFVILEKHRESVAHEDALLLEEDIMRENEEDSIIQEQVNHFRPEVWDLGRGWVDDGGAIPEEEIAAVMEPFNHFLGSTELSGGVGEFFQNGLDFSVEEFMEGVYGEVQNNLA